MKTFTANFQKAEKALREFNHVKKVSKFATIRFMIGCCVIVGGHGFPTS